MSVALVVVITHYDFVFLHFHWQIQRETHRILQVHFSFILDKCGSARSPTKERKKHAKFQWTPNNWSPHRFVCFCSSPAYCTRCSCTNTKTVNKEEEKKKHLIRPHEWAKKIEKTGTKGILWKRKPLRWRVAGGTRCAHTQLLKNGLILSVGATVKKVHFRQRARFLVSCCLESAPASSACHERTQFFFGCK